MTSGVGACTTRYEQGKRNRNERRTGATKLAIVAHLRVGRIQRRPAMAIAEKKANGTKIAQPRPEASAESCPSRLAGNAVPKRTASAFRYVSNWSKKYRSLPSAVAPRTTKRGAASQRKGPRRREPIASKLPQRAALSTTASPYQTQSRAPKRARRCHRRATSDEPTRMAGRSKHASAKHPHTKAR